jgi:acyl carrier protein
MLIVAGEPFGPELVDRWVRPGREFHNAYGPTETTVLCTDHRCEPGRGSTPIGRAMVNHWVYVLDGWLRPVPVGVAGELFVAGVGLARGYLNRPDVTARQFVPDPLGGVAGQRMYRTGDRVRWTEDGVLEFLGRVDRQVKIRGVRIEPGEVEQALVSHPGVRQAVVTVVSGGLGGEAQLAGYVVAAGSGVDEAGLRAYLVDRLPMSMVPATVTVVAALPVNSSGKVDVARLPAPVRQSVRRRAPGTATERLVAGIWQELLGVPADQLAVEDSFFALGGNSLQAIQLISRVRDTTNTHLDLRQVFVADTLVGLAGLIDSVRDDAARTAVRRRVEADVAELSEEELDRLLAAGQS